MKSAICTLLPVVFALFTLTLLGCEREVVETGAAPETTAEKVAVTKAAAESPAGAQAQADGEVCPAPNGKAVMEYITKDNPYTQWQMWPGKEALYPGQHPHGAFLTTYVSPLAYYAIEDKGGEIPDTGFIVKENYTAEKELAAVTVMYKREGYNPDAGNWFWLKYTPDGKIEAEGKVEGCIGCHSARQENDWLFTGEL